MSSQQDITAGASEKDRYKIPNWIGKPPNGSHLDVSKGDQLLQKVMVDEKSAYYFGRNPNLCDIITGLFSFFVYAIHDSEHASCSRVHAVLLYHKILKRFALVDLESCKFLKFFGWVALIIMDFVAAGHCQPNCFRELFQRTQRHISAELFQRHVSTTRFSDMFQPICFNELVPTTRFSNMCQPICFNFFRKCKLQKTIRQSINGG
jgi:hypothetical protein